MHAGTAMEDDDLVETDDEDLESIEPDQGSSRPDASSSGEASSYGQEKKKHYFCKELRCMMYGFGDDKVPYTETVELLEEMVVQFMCEVTWKALGVGKPGRVTLEDIWYLIRRDPKKYAKVKDLLTMSEELRKARKAFDEAKFSAQNG